MPTKIAEGTTRYNVVFAHTTIVLFALWCVGHLISTKDVDFSLGGARGMLMFGLLLTLCGSLLAHDFSGRDLFSLQIRFCGRGLFSSQIRCALGGH